MAARLAARHLFCLDCGKEHDGACPPEEIRLAHPDFNHFVNQTINRTMCGATPVEPVYVEGRDFCDECEISAAMEVLAG